MGCLVFLFFRRHALVEQAPNPKRVLFRRGFAVKDYAMLLVLLMTLIRIMGGLQVPIGSVVVPFCGLHLGSYKVIPKRNYMEWNYYGAFG